jgi:peroxiredoxin family protein
MFILLVASSDTPKTLETVQNLTQASLSKGHRVTVFFNSQSTRLLSANRGLKNALSGLDARLLACRTSAQEMGIDSAGDLIDGAELSSLGEFVELMGEAERALFLG